MRRRKVSADPVEAAIQAAGTIGALERMAGIGPDIDARRAFWLSLPRDTPSGPSLDSGVAELKRRIRAKATA